MKKSLIALSLAICSASTFASEWGYEGEHGPENWGHVSETCSAGKNQSPIDISNAEKATHKPLAIHYSGKVTALTNNGHTLQATVEGDNEIVVDGKHFALKQFHFHTPSENLIKHHQYPLEAHFVNADENGNLAVVAVMFDQGSDNPFIASLTQTLPTKEHTQTLAKSFDVASLLPDTAQYYRFNGSLTTPPCSEGVRWFVMKQPQGLSADQLEKMHGMLGNNNRPVQDINARLVTEY